jgi:hypothetical protein
MTGSKSMASDNQPANPQTTAADRLFALCAQQNAQIADYRAGVCRYRQSRGNISVSKSDTPPDVRPSAEVDQPPQADTN